MMKERKKPNDEIKPENIGKIKCCSKRSINYLVHFHSKTKKYINKRKFNVMTYFA